jgi:hypothetical protein
MLTSDDLFRIADCAFTLYEHGGKIKHAESWEFVIRTTHTDVLERKILIEVEKRSFYGVCRVIVEHGNVYIESTARPSQSVGEYTVADLVMIENLTPIDHTQSSTNW